MNNRVQITTDQFSFVADRFVTNGTLGTIIGTNADDGLEVVRFDGFPCGIQVPVHFLKEVQDEE